MPRRQDAKKTRTMYLFDETINKGIADRQATRSDLLCPLFSEVRIVPMKRSQYVQDNSGLWVFLWSDALE
jgi:hypothetical protein